MYSFETHLGYFVPLRSIHLARHSRDVLVEFQETGKAIAFTPGELRSIEDMNDAAFAEFERMREANPPAPGEPEPAYVGFLREPTADEMPVE